MPSTALVDISNVKKFVGNKKFVDFDQHEINDENNVDIRTVRKTKEDENNPLKNLYLLISNNEEQFNGIILEKDTNKVVCASQNKVNEINTQESLVDKINTSTDNLIRYEYCEDGTIIRLYNYNDTWYTATTKCIDARSSYWSSKKSFDEMFWECFDKSLLQNLDKSHTYVFVLLHSENRIVVRHTKNMLVYVSQINNETMTEDFVNVFKGVYGIKRPNLILEFNPLEVTKYFHPFKRGILVKIYDRINKIWNVYKYDFENYTLIKEIRGNVPEIRYRYLELLNNKEYIENLEYYYQEHIVMFTIIKSSLRNLVNAIYKLYVESHIKHSVKIEDDNLFYITLKQLHAQYKQTNKSITYDDVVNKIYNMDKVVLRKLLKWN